MREVSVIMHLNVFKFGSVNLHDGSQIESRSWSWIVAARGHSQGRNQQQNQHQLQNAKIMTTIIIKCIKYNWTCLVESVEMVFQRLEQSRRATWIRINNISTEIRIYRKLTHFSRAFCTISSLMLDVSVSFTLTLKLRFLLIVTTLLLFSSARS